MPDDPLPPEVGQPRPAGRPTDDPGGPAQPAPTRRDLVRAAPALLAPGLLVGPAGTRAGATPAAVAPRLPDDLTLGLAGGGPSAPLRPLPPIAAGAGGAAPAASPDLASLCRAFARLHAQINDEATPPRAARRLYRAHAEMKAAIAGTPAISLAGLAAKVLALTEGGTMELPEALVGECEALAAWATDVADDPTPDEGPSP